MKREPRSWSFGRLAIATLVVASLALSAILLWRRSAESDRAPEVPAVAAPEVRWFPKLPPSPPPVQPPEAERSRPRAASAEGPSSPSQSGERFVPEVENTGLQAEAQSPGRDGLASPERAPASPENVAPTGGVTPAGRAAPAASPAASGQRASAPVPVAPTSRPDSPAPWSAGSQTGTVVSSPPPQEEDPPSNQGKASPEPEATPEETPADVEPDSDRTPPTLQGLRFDPPVVEGGSATMLTIQASDDLPGVKSIVGEIRSPNGRAVLPFLPQAAGDGLFTISIAIPRQAETGVWYVAWISLTDGANNTALIRAPSAAAPLPGGTFSVQSADSDSTPPEVLGILFEKMVVGGGEKNVIEVDARDDRSGVASVTGAIQNVSKSARIWFTCAMNQESGIWRGDISMPSNADCGEWTVQQLAANDVAGNTTLLIGNSPQLARAGFQVYSRPDCDPSPPTLDGFDLSPTIVTNQVATDVLVTATVHDEGSGTAAVKGWFEGPASTGGQPPKIYFQCSPDPRDPAAPWTGRLQMPQYAAKGTWKPAVIRLQDKAMNFREYTPADPVLSGRVIEVQ